MTQNHAHNETLSTINRAPRVTKYANEVIERVGIYNNPYFKSLQDGTMSLELFQKTQEQFYYAVLFFSRPMAALVGRIPSPKARLDILHNVLEEHGDLSEDDFHASTFRKFLKTINVDATTTTDFLFLCPPIRAFNSCLTTSCTFDEVEVGVGCMGVIEHAFATISGIIGKTVVKRGWIKQEDLIHYKLHEEIDERHAEEFFAVVEGMWDRERSQYFTKQGIELGVYIFDRLYRDLYEANWPVEHRPVKHFIEWD